MRILATHDNVILEKEVKPKTKLVLADHVAESIFRRWKVYAVGPDVKGLTKGQYVVFNSPTAGEIEHEDKKYVILPDSHVVAVYEG